MAKRLVCIWLGCATLLFGKWPGSAHACEPMPEGIVSRRSAPADGASGVPLNAQITVEYCAAPDYRSFAVPQLRMAAGRGVAVHALPTQRHRALSGASVCWLQTFVPDELLRPHTRYELVDRFPYLPQHYWMEQDWTTPYAPFATFTTGDRIDETPPRFFGLTERNDAPLEVCDSDACCGSHILASTWLVWSQAEDETTPSKSLRYQVFSPRDPTRPLVTFLDRHSVVVVRACSGVEPWHDRPHLALPRSSGSASFVVRAMDLAGNSDGNTQIISVARSCSPPSDAGIADQGGSADVAAGPEAARQSDGCATAPSAIPASSLLCVLLLLLGCGTWRSISRRS